MISNTNYYNITGTPITFTSVQSGITSTQNSFNNNILNDIYTCDNGTYTKPIGGGYVTNNSGILVLSSPTQVNLTILCIFTFTGGTLTPLSVIGSLRITRLA